MTQDEMVGWHHRLMDMGLSQSWETVSVHKSRGRDGRDGHELLTHSLPSLRSRFPAGAPAPTYYLEVRKEPLSFHCFFKMAL